MPNDATQEELEEMDDREMDSEIYGDDFILPND